jgi:hypothetical protein
MHPVFALKFRIIHCLSASFLSAGCRSRFRCPIHAARRHPTAILHLAGFLSAVLGRDAFSLIAGSRLMAEDG